MAAESRMTLLEHFDELRRRVFRAAIVFLIATVVSFSFLYEPIKYVLVAPLEVTNAKTTNVIVNYNPLLRLVRPYIAGAAPAEAVRLHAMSVMEVFMVKFKMSMLGGLVLGAPVIFYQAWAFIGAGLMPRERKVILRYLPLSVGLFMAGVVFAYFTLIPFALLYLLTVDPDIGLMLMYGTYVSLVLVMLACVGVAFQLPLVMMALSRMGMVSAATLAHSRRYSIVIMFIVAALLTPSPEPFSQCLLAIPMVGLYELGILLAKLAEKRRAENA